MSGERAEHKAREHKAPDEVPCLDAFVWDGDVRHCDRLEVAKIGALADESRQSHTVCSGCQRALARGAPCHWRRLPPGAGGEHHQ
jgi:hypothetical protein